MQLEFPEPSKTLFTDFPSSCLQYIIDYIHPEAGPLEPHQIGTIACLG